MQKLFVTKPSLPDFEDFEPYLRQIWKNRILTNNGPFHQQFEEELAKYLGVNYVSLFTNATFALISSLQVLRIKGEVITTPYTFVATPHSLFWNNVKPVFCDINATDCNIDVDKIERLITPNTTAIMPVHVYGNPCNYKKIEEIAKTYGLKVIYDAAHAFDIREDGKSILNYGDLSILSFHATKIFNTFEGGAIISHDLETKTRIDNLKNFGFKDEVTVIAPGLNGKMNEFQAALGLVQLKRINNDIEKCKKIAAYYKERIHKIKGIRLLNERENVQYNYSYFPIFIEKEYPITRNELYDKFKEHDIFARRYFYPLVTEFNPYKQDAKTFLPVAHQTAEEVICLPMYAELDKESQDKIIDILNG